MNIQISFLKIYYRTWHCSHHSYTMSWLLEPEPHNSTGSCMCRKPSSILRSDNLHWRFFCETSSWVNIQIGAFGDELGWNILGEIAIQRASRRINSVTRTSTKNHFRWHLIFFTYGSQFHGASRKNSVDPTKEPPVCKWVYTDGLRNSTACVNCPFTHRSYNNNRLCKYHLHRRLS
jgi:hypothetical protein